MITYNLRDIGPAGGYIFYINSNAAADGWTYLEAVPDDTIITGTYQWSDVTSLTSGATGTVYGTGLSNTNLIVSQVGHTTSAAKLCDDLIYGGYSDWFLPSIDELTEMYNVLQNTAPSLGGFTLDYYWSSSEYSGAPNTDAYLKNFNTNVTLNATKVMAKYVRAARRF